MASFKKVHRELVDQLMDNTGGIFSSYKEVLAYASKESLQANAAFNQALANDPDLNGTAVYEAFCAVVFSNLEQMTHEDKKAFISRCIKNLNLDCEKANLLELIKASVLQHDNGDIDDSTLVRDIEAHITSHKNLSRQENLFIAEMVDRIIKDIEKDGFNNLVFGNLDYLSEIAFAIKIEQVKAE